MCRWISFGVGLDRFWVEGSWGWMEPSLEEVLGWIWQVGSRRQPHRVCSWLRRKLWLAKAVVQPRREVMGLETCFRGYVSGPVPLRRQVDGNKRELYSQVDGTSPWTRQLEGWDSRANQGSMREKAPVGDVHAQTHVHTQGGAKVGLWLFM